MWQLNVFNGGLLRVPLGLHWVGSSQDRGASVQLTDDSSLRQEESDAMSEHEVGMFFFSFFLAN